MFLTLCSKPRFSFESVMINLTNVVSYSHTILTRLPTGISRMLSNLAIPAIAIPGQYVPPGHMVSTA